MEVHGTQCVEVGQKGLPGVFYEQTAEVFMAHMKSGCCIMQGKLFLIMTSNVLENFIHAFEVFLFLFFDLRT